MLPVEAVELRPAAEPRPSVAPDPRVNAPAPVTAKVEQFRVPLTVAVLVVGMATETPRFTVLVAFTVKPCPNVGAVPEIVDVPLNTKPPRVGFNDRVPLLTRFPFNVMVLAPIVSVLPVPTVKIPATGINPVKPVAVQETVPAPVAPNERSPLIVHALAPDGAVSVIIPEVLSKLRFP